MKPETLIGKTPNLQAPSRTVVQLLDLLNRSQADIGEVVATVRRDAVLSAKLLAVCNSVNYGLAQPVASLEQGVLYLGYGEIHRLVMALSFGAQIGIELPGYDMEAGALWRHSLVTALLTPRVLSLSRKLAADTSIAYTAGLLHDIGKLVLSQMLDGVRRDQIRELVELRGASLLQAEKQVIGCDHAEIGACLLRQWRIPEVIVAAVAAHHDPALTRGPQLSAVVHVADTVAHQSGASPGWESFAVVRHDTALDALGLSAFDVETLMFASLDVDNIVSQQAPAPAAPSCAAVAAGTDF